MSGLEALSLVCNTMQIISAAHSTVSFCKAIYQGRSPDAHLSDNAVSLASLSDEVEMFYASTDPPRTANERSLADVAKKCNIAARALEEEVNFLMGNHAKGNLPATIKTAVKANWRKSRLEKLEKSLENYQKTMESHLLARVFKQSEAIALQQREGFDELSKDLKYFALQYSLGHTQLSNLVKEEFLKEREQSSRELKQTEETVKSHMTSSLAATGYTITAHVTAQARESASLITQNAHELHVQGIRKDQRERLLRSLKFPSMNERHNDIADSHENTFKWIFDSLQETIDESRDEEYESDRSDSDTWSTISESVSLSQSSEPIYAREQQTWDSFSDWLKSDCKIFWISGKPGSGKSTLVKYIVSAPPTIAGLKLWRSECRILYHFFWKPGSMMQRNIKGMLCSLLYQIISSDPEIADLSRKQLDQMTIKDTDTDWSLKELQLLLLTFLGTHSAAFCIFLDGLDEICNGDGAGAVLKVVAELKNIPNVKLCLASRPEPYFRKRLSSEQHLKLEDLTARDMERYARSMLRPYSARDQIRSERDIVWDLVSKAEGVFLWLHLAMRSLIDGLENGDSEDELIERLRAFPRELSKLYSDMWARLNGSATIYQKSAAKHFKLLIRTIVLDQEFNHHYMGRPIYDDYPVLKFMTASNPTVQKALLSPKPLMSELDLDAACSTFRSEVLVRCAGLVEIRERGISGDEIWMESHGLPYILKRHLQSRVKFVHRTAYDSN